MIIKWGGVGWGHKVKNNDSMAPTVSIKYGLLSKHWLPYFRSITVPIIYSVSLTSILSEINYISLSLEVTDKPDIYSVRVMLINYFSFRLMNIDVI